MLEKGQAAPPSLFEGGVYFFFECVEAALASVCVCLLSAACGHSWEEGVPLTTLFSGSFLSCLGAGCSGAAHSQRLFAASAGLVQRQQQQQWCAPPSSFVDAIGGGEVLVFCALGRWRALLWALRACADQRRGGGWDLE